MAIEFKVGLCVRLKGDHYSWKENAKKEGVIELQPNFTYTISEITKSKGNGTTLRFKEIDNSKSLFYERYNKMPAYLAEDFKLIKSYENVLNDLNDILDNL